MEILKEGRPDISTRVSSQKLGCAQSILKLSNLLSFSITLCRGENMEILKEDHPVVSERKLLEDPVALFRKS